MPFQTTGFETLKGPQNVDPWPKVKQWNAAIKSIHGKIFFFIIPVFVCFAGKRLFILLSER